MSIERLNQGTITSSSQIPFHDSTNGRDARCSLSDLAAAIVPMIAGSGGYITQYASPNASPYTVTVAPPTQGTSMFVLLTPTGTIASLTLLLPIGSDGQEVVVCSTQALTSLTVTGATVGASPQPVNGAPTTLAANGFFRLRFDGVNSAWYRI